MRFIRAFPRSGAPGLTLPRVHRYILHAKKTAFIVEHDIVMATYLADRVVVYSGTPSVESFATAPESLLTGMCVALVPCSDAQVES